MRALIAKLLLASRVKRDDLKHQKKFLSWEQVEKVAILVSTDQHPNKSELDKFTAGLGKFVEVFFVEPGSKTASFGDCTCFTKKDRGFFGLPTKAVELALKNKRFDVLINTCAGNNLYAAAIASGLPASLKTAAGSGIHSADLIVASTHPDRVTEVLTDTLHYLKMIRA